MTRAIYQGPDTECRTHFGVRVRGVPFEWAEGEAEFVAKHLPQHKFEAEGFKAATKPAPAQVKKK